MTEIVKDYEEFLTPDDFKKIGEDVPENLEEINGHPDSDASKFFSNEEDVKVLKEDNDEKIIGTTKDGKPIYRQERYEEVLGGGIPSKH